jgi:hypothetical protein
MVKTPATPAETILGIGDGLPMKAARKLLAAASLGLLAACAPDGIVDQIAREAAKDAVRPVLRRNFPGIPLEPSVNCVIYNASAGEILTLAEAGATGQPDARTAQLVLDIVQRPATVECLATEGLAAFLS